MKTQTQRAESHVRMGEDIGVIRVTLQPAGGMQLFWTVGCEQKASVSSPPSSLSPSLRHLLQAVKLRRQLASLHNCMEGSVQGSCPTQQTVCEGNNKPSCPKQLIFLGFVTVTNQQYILQMFGGRISELHVCPTSPKDPGPCGSFLFYCSPAHGPLNIPST